MADLNTDAGRAARVIANEIAESKALNRWKELMDLYYKEGTPQAKVEVIRIAVTLADVAGKLDWKMECSAKINGLKQRGYI